jgi:hypothetical protein
MISNHFTLSDSVLQEYFATNTSFNTDPPMFTADFANNADYLRRGS